MTQAQNSTNPQEKKSNSRKGLIIAFVIILLAINGVQLYFNLNQNAQIDEQKVTIENNTKRIDSLDLALSSEITKLKALQARYDSLGIQNDSLESFIAELETQRDNYKKNADANYSKYKKYEKLLAEANAKRDEYMTKADRYEQLLAEQEKMMKQKDSSIASQQQTISKMEQTEKDLQQKVAIASVLRAESFKVQALSAKGKAKEGTEFKAKSIDMLKIQFNIGENKVAPKGPRDVYMRLIEPDGSVIVNTETGGGSFKDANGKDQPFTSKTSVTYMNNNQGVTFDYKKGAAYKVGKHRVEIYCEGYKIGESTFDVAK